MENILQNQKTSNQSQVFEVNRKNWMKIILLGFAETILIVGSFYTGLKYSENKESRISTLLPTPTVTSQQPTKSPEITPIPEIESTVAWRKYGENSVISFDYPNGWHIYSGWFEKQGDPMEILLDPEPLSGTPRGGPISTISIGDYSGNENPDAVLERNLSLAKDNIIDVKETSFIIRGAKVYKFEGKINLYNEMVPVLEYHTLLRGDNTDNINTHVIKASLTYFRDDEKRQKYSKILDRLVRSLKHKNQK